MFLYALLTLLPATTLALACCDECAMRRLYDSLDHNSDDSVTRAEVDEFVKALDVNGDTELIIEEVKSRVDDVAPALKDDVDVLFGFIDSDSNKRINEKDVNFIFTKIDFNRDNAVSTKEYNRFLKTYCQLSKLGCLLTGK